MRVPGALPRDLVHGLVEHFSARRRSRQQLVRQPRAHRDAAARRQPAARRGRGACITPKLADFGALLFGERLGWSLKEMWVNVLDTGGRQAMHNHANSFISGVVYLTPTHPGCAHRVHEVAGRHRVLVQERPRRRRRPGPYNADKWISPPPEPGDMVLFPSYLMHAVPPNPGERRITLSFNAIPTQLDSWGYKISFSG